jgi:hypothetical protein
MRLTNSCSSRSFVAGDGALSGRRGQLARDRHFLALGERLHPAGRVGHDLAQVDRVAAHGHVTLFDTGEIEQLGDHLRQPVRLSRRCDPTEARTAGRSVGSFDLPSTRFRRGRRRLVTGVRSSCDRLSTNSVRMRRSRTSSDRSRTTSHAPSIGAGREAGMCAAAQCRC